MIVDTFTNMTIGNELHTTYQCSPLAYSPQKYPDGKPMYWTTLSTAGTDESELFHFVMRHELVKALKLTGIIKPLQNRVLPTGEIVASTARCDMMGNRGTTKLHSKDRELNVQYTPRIDWKTCTLTATDKAGNNIQRELMGKYYTELFYLDEATAYAGVLGTVYLIDRHLISVIVHTWHKLHEL